MSFEAYECSNCGESFKATGDAQAAKAGYCSPACETEGKELT